MVTSFVDAIDALEVDLGRLAGLFGAVSGGSTPDAGLPELEEGASSHFRTSSTGRALLLAQDRRWMGSTVIFVIALLDFNTLDW